MFQPESKSEGRRLLSQLKDCQAERKFCLLHLFVLFRPSADGARPNQAGKGRLPDSVY